MSIIVETPFQNFTGLDGKPLANGKVYIGQVGTDPTVLANQIPVFWDEAMTIPAFQPLTVNAGYIVNIGTPARVWLNSDYSISVKNASNILVYYIAQFGITNVPSSEALASGSGASLVGWMQIGIGAVLRTLLNKVREVFSFKDFGAEGAGLDETTKLQAAASARGGDGFGQSELTLPPGDYFISESTNAHAIELMSDTHVRGTGGQLRAGFQNFNMLASFGADNISVDGVKFTTASTFGNDQRCGIYSSCENNVVRNYRLSFNHLQNTSWGMLCQAQEGTGKYIGPRFIGNFVESTTPGTKSDGMHMVGNVIGGVMVGNAVYGRADAAGAMNAIAGNTGYGNVMAASAHVDCLVGVDISGSQYGVVSGVNARNTVNHAASNPCVRAITYTGSDPKYHIINAVMAIGEHGLSGEFDAKVDAAGADTHISISALMLKSFYTNARFVNLNGNHFLEGAQIFIDNNAGEIFIGPNTFEGEFNISGQGNPGLAGNVYVSKQNWTRQYHPNFLPDYSTANPFWALSWFFDADRTLVTNTSAVINSTSPMDVTNGIFVLDRPCIVDGIVAVADLDSHTGYITICDMSNNELVRAEFPTTPGTGVTNAVCVLAGPVMSGNVYKAKLVPGTYKLRAWSIVNNMTIKNASLMLWS